MKTAVIRKKVVDEISKIPDENVPELFEYIHYFRLGLVQKPSNSEKIMQFAGCWKDMDNYEFKNFLSNVQARRKNAFKSRRDRETSSD